MLEQKVWKKKNDCFRIAENATWLYCLHLFEISNNIDIFIKYDCYDEEKMSVKIRVERLRYNKMENRLIIVRSWGFTSVINLIYSVYRNFY